MNLAEAHAANANHGEGAAGSTPREAISRLRGISHSRRRTGPNPAAVELPGWTQTSTAFQDKCRAVEFGDRWPRRCSLAGGRTEQLWLRNFLLPAERSCRPRRSLRDRTLSLIRGRDSQMLFALRRD